MQQDIQNYYATNNPGQVQVVGVDLWNGTASQLNVFKQQTGATYPLALNGATATGGNVESLYGTYDNYVIVNKQGIVRYHASLTWPHGNRYHLNEIRAAVDSLVTPVLDVPGGPARPLALSAGPNPARGAVRITLTTPRALDAARVTVHDVAGREVSVLWVGTLDAGTREFAWDARDTGGARVAPGLYLVHARLGSESLTRRVVVTR